METEKILYLDCGSGISGDMTVGALLDLGGDRVRLKKALESLGIGGYHLHFGRTLKCGIDAYDFDVHLEDDGHGHPHEHEHHHDHEHLHDHEHPHDHEHHHDHSHVHRNLADIYEVIGRMKEKDEVKELARNIFRIVAEAESKAHGLPIEQVHFHEVGAVDSIIDIVSTAVLLDDLGISTVIVSPLAEGRGYVRCQHGIMPVPVPATANIAAAYHLELEFTDNDGEMVTPTGAAIAAALHSGKEMPRRYVIEKIGIGAGNKEFRQANILRAMILSPKENPGTLWKLETNMDDCTGEALGYTMEKLLGEGALDVYYTPIQMKKNRPAYELSVICREEKREKLEDIIFCHTTTIGIRRYPVERTALERRQIQVETPYGTVWVKACDEKENTRYYPEYESVREICDHHGIPFQEAYHQIEQWAKEQEERQETV